MSEQSLKATSTPSRLILLSFLHYHHHPRPPNSLPTAHNNPAASPSPPLRDVGSTTNAPATAVSVPPLPSPEGCGRRLSFDGGITMARQMTRTTGANDNNEEGELPRSMKTANNGPPTIT